MIFISRKNKSLNKDNLSLLVLAALIILLGMLVSNIDSIFPTPAAAEKLRDIIRTVNYSGEPTGTNPDAEVTVVEFSDFQCPACQVGAGEVKKLLEHYGDKINFVFRHFPIKDGSARAAEAAECAGDQGKFWEYHDLLFQNLHKVSVPELEMYAVQAGLDTGRFTDCLETGENRAKVDSDFREAYKIGVKGTPSFVIDGVLITGAISFSEFRKIIDPKLK